MGELRGLRELRELREKNGGAEGAEGEEWGLIALRTSVRTSLNPEIL
ncbi:MAG: hypothetical protein F6J86_33700 [Symploca sp. SIO1B1]|nr:hypothetical protein [Symploca sp. SIO1B1]